MLCANLLSRGIPRPGPENYFTTEGQGKFGLMVTGPWEEPNLLVPLVLPYSATLWACLGGLNSIPPV